MSVSAQKRIAVLFEFMVEKPKPNFYRAVRATDGGYRFERKGATAKSYKPFMWTGGADGIVAHWNAIRSHYGYKGPVPDWIAAQASGAVDLSKGEK